MQLEKFCKKVKLDPDAMLANLRREGRSKRVHYLELFIDGEVADAVSKRFDLVKDLRADDPHFRLKKWMAVQRFLGYEFIYVHVPFEMPLHNTVVADTAALAHEGGRWYRDEHKGPITTWEEFEKYPWPNVANSSDEDLVWFEKNLPDDMFVIANSGAHYCEYLTWLMGYETFCFALHEQRDLVQAIYDKLLEISKQVLAKVKPFKRVKAVWGSDDMGFKTQPLFAPKDMREFVLSAHKQSAALAHEMGLLYLLHSCGNLRSLMSDLLDDVKIDAKHSFEDVIQPVTEAKREFGNRCALLGGIDMDFITRADEPAVRKRVRETLDVCMPGGGYCLGTGNTVANYIPIENYLAMLDEGRKYC